MNYKVLYRKYRPSDFNNLIGQDYTKKMLTNIIISDKIGHAYIFTGPRGTGKTSSAKLFAKAINCLNNVDGNPCGKCENCQLFADSPDIIEIDAASNNGVDEMRELIDNVKLSPSSLKYKVYIIDEVHMLSQSAFNALLLTLEEPPGHVVFILATTDIQNVPITILSRCQRFDFRPIENKHIIERMRYISNAEKIDISDDALEEIAFISAGGMRDALSILDQLAADNKKIDAEIVISNFGTISTERIKNFVTHFVANDVDEVLRFLNDVRDKGVYYSVFVEKLILELRNYAISIKLGKEDYNFDIIYDLILELNNCLANINVNINPYTLIEMAVLKFLNMNDQYSGNLENKEIVESSTIAEIEVKKPENIETKMVDIDEAENISREISESKSEITESSGPTSKIKVQIDDAFLKVRVNNCFAGVNKNAKKELTDKWQGVLDHLAVSDMYMMSLLADCEVEAASSDYAIISCNVDSTNALINNSINEIETLFSNLYNRSWKFVALTKSEWQTAKEEYIDKTKNNIPYTLIDEEYSETILDESDELEKLATEIFGSNNIEFE